VKLLAIDTATENCSAAVLIDGRLIAREIELQRGHAERILPMVDELLAEACTTLRALDGIAFGRGPGAFTGVRLAASVTQGLAFGAGIGVIGISELRAVAQRVFDSDTTIRRVLVCNDARMHEVYWACFERGPDGLASAVGDEHVGKPSTVVLPTGWDVPAVYGAGRGFAAYPDLRSTFAGSLADVYDWLLPRAADIARLAAPEVKAGRLMDAEDAIPVYLRDEVAHVRNPSRLGTP
jgi:tRNA threonylcarbamoyladenosine biosynthesis protein TsaB